MSGGNGAMTGVDAAGSREWGQVRLRGGRFYVRFTVKNKRYERGPFMTWAAADKQRRAARALLEGGVDVAAVLTEVFGDLTGSRHTLREERSSEALTGARSFPAPTLTGDGGGSDAYWCLKWEVGEWCEIEFDNHRKWSIWKSGPWQRKSLSSTKPASANDATDALSLRGSSAAEFIAYVYRLADNIDSLVDSAKGDNRRSTTQLRDISDIVRFAIDATGGLRRAAPMNAPACISGVPGLIQHHQDSESLVYFLVRDGVVVYVGESENGHVTRMRAHQRDKDFDSVWYFHVPSAIRIEMEREWIARLCPEYNKAMKPVRAMESV